MDILKGSEVLHQDMKTNKCSEEISGGNRFEFGKNWGRFLRVLDDESISRAEASLKVMLETEDLKDISFLDIGSGSGLFSLAARRLGAKVHSFDYDPASVACTRELKRRYFLDDPGWTIEEGSVLDQDYIGSLGKFDVVYSWGVLHHSGDMWQAFENVAATVGQNGKLFISIYNDQGRASRIWLKVKKAYNRLPRGLRFLVLWPAVLRLRGPSTIRNILKGTHFAGGKNRKRARGMSSWSDVIDWVGGYPFEVAKPEEIFDFYRAKDFELLKLKTCAGGIGCNEFVFQKRREKEQ